jgi:hypothetical protein
MLPADAACTAKVPAFVTVLAILLPSGLHTALAGWFAVAVDSIMEPYSLCDFELYMAIKMGF